MPYKSQAQAGLFHSPNSPVSPAKVAEFDAATKGKHLPKRAAAGGEVPKKKVVDHGDHFKVHSADGSQFTIAKRGLHPATVKHIAKMACGGAVKMADGGEPGTAAAEQAQVKRMDANPQEFETQVDECGNQLQEENKAAEDVSSNAGTYGTDAGNVEDPEAGQRQVAGTSDGTISGSYIDKKAPSTPLPPGADPIAEQPPEAAGGPALQGYMAPTVHAQTPAEYAAAEAGKAARTGDAIEQERISGEVGKVQDLKVKQEQELKASSDIHFADIQGRAAKLREEIQNGKIDPDHYWQVRGTGGRIAASIGLLLSGLGAGLGHTENMAMKVIQNNIDRDIDSQKANLETKKGLLADTYRETGDLRLSVEMARHFYTNIAQAQLNKLAAQSSSSVVKARAAEVNAAVDLSQAQKAREISDRRSLYQANAGNAGRHDQNALAMAQAKASGKGEKTINDRTNFQIGSLRQMANLIGEMRGAVPTPGKVAAGKFIPGDRTVDHWEDMRNKLALEQGKISKQGTPDKEEVNRFLERGTKADTITSEGAHKKFLNEQHAWGLGQASAIGDQFVQEGRKDPFGDIPGWAWKDRHNPDGSAKVAKPGEFQ